MGKKLAIKGHVSRSKEVVELLKMMGGCECGYSGGVMDCYYYISQFGNIEASYKPYEFDTYIVYTLEEFLEKYPFKVGDKVFLYDNITEGYVTGMEWDEDNGTVKYCVYTSAEYWCDVKLLLKWNPIDFLDDKHHSKKENMEEKKINQMSLVNCDLDEVEIVLGDKFELEIKDGKYYAVRKKLVYPKTYLECREILPNDVYYDGFSIFTTLQTLIICRNAYWKIAGEEMGLDGPWEPKFGKYILFSIKFYLYQDNFVLHKGEYSSSDNCILVFPTEEMRDVFYENFKDLIEQCKELL